jgi:hypothetical protein
VALAGVLLQQSGASAAFLFNGLTFLFSAMTVWLVAAPTAPAAPVSRGAAWGQLVRSWHEIAVLVRRTRGLAWHVTLATADSVAVNLFNLLVVAIIAERFEDSAYWLSVVGCAFAIGAIATGPVVSSLATHCGSRLSVAVALGGQAACFALLGLTQLGWVTVILSFVLGAFNTISWTVVTTTLQISLGGLVRGRIAAARSLLAAVLTVLLVPLVSQAETLSLAWALALAGAVCLAFALIALIFGLCRGPAIGMLGQPQHAPAPGV